MAKYIGSYQATVTKDTDVIPAIFEQINDKRIALSLSNKDELDYVEVYCDPQNINGGITVTGYINGDTVPMVTINSQSICAMDYSMDNIYRFVFKIDKAQTKIDCIKFNYDCNVMVKYGYSDFIN